MRDRPCDQLTKKLYSYYLKYVNMKPKYMQDDNGDMYSPEYDDWNDQKQRLNFEKAENSEKRYPPYKDSDIWWTNIGLNIGAEIYGKGEDFRRPVLVLKKMGSMFLGVPLTSQNKYNNPGFLQVTYRKEKSSWAILSQVKVFSAYRLLHKDRLVGGISGKMLNTVKTEIKNFFDL